MRVDHKVIKDDQIRGRGSEKGDSFFFVELVPYLLNIWVCYRLILYQRSWNWAGK